MKRVLIAFESSGETRDAFRRAGFDAWSLDLLPGRGEFPEYHLQRDAFEYLEAHAHEWDFMLAHPTCTYMCSSGLHWNHKRHGRHALTLYWLDKVRFLMGLPIPLIAIENPVGAIGTQIRPADQYIQPYEYGHDASKRTGLWLKGLPLLKPDPANYVQPRMVDGKPRWANQTDSGQNALPPSADRWQVRSETYAGWSDAMVAQWGPTINATERVAA